MSVHTNPGFMTQLQPPVALENPEHLIAIKNEPPKSEIVEMSMDDILVSPSEEIIPDTKDIDIVSHVINEDSIKSETVPNYVLETKHSESVETHGFVKIENSSFITQNENSIKTEDSDGNLSRDTGHGVVEVQGSSEDFYALDNLKINEQHVLNFSNALSDVNIRCSEAKHPPIENNPYRTCETISRKEDQEKITVIETPLILVERHEYTSLAKDRHLCNHCQRVFKKLKFIKFHIRKMHRELTRMYQCPYCPYKTKFNLRFHIIQKHKDTKDIQRFQYYCDVCSYNTFDSCRFERHKSIHLKPEKIQYFHCYHCAYKSKRKGDLKAHIFNHFKNEDVPFYCYICEFMTLTRDSIIEHFKKHSKHHSICDEADYKYHFETYNSKPENRYRCDECNYKSYKRQHLKRHKLIHLNPEEIQYFRCYHCFYKSKVKEVLKRHVLQHFKNKEVPFHCHICDFMTRDRDSIIEHFEKHLKRSRLNTNNQTIETKYQRKTRISKPEERYCCDECSYKTYASHLLKRHKSIHLKPEEIQYFHCYHCAHKYKRKDKLKTHIFMHFKNEDVTFHCYICDFITLKRDLIVEHFKNHSEHHSKREELKTYTKILKKRYCCYKCAYNTFDSFRFKRHKLIHLKPEEIQYFHCYHCSQKYKRKEGLNFHIFKHFKNEEVPFHCYVCDFMTLKRNLIIEHIKKHAKVKPYELSPETETKMDNQYLKHCCDKCNYKTFVRQHLNRHKLIHLKPEKIHHFHCYHCSFKAKRKDGLKTHIFQHFKNGEVTFHCYICDFMTLKRELVIKHIKKHSKDQIKTEINEGSLS